MAAGVIGKGKWKGHFQPLAKDAGGRVQICQKFGTCGRVLLWPWGVVLDVLETAGVSVRSAFLSEATKSMALHEALDSLADSTELGSWRDFVLVGVDGTPLRFSALRSRLGDALAVVRSKQASARWSVNDVPKFAGKAAPLLGKLLQRKRLYSSHSSALAVLQLARFNAWQHLSARSDSQPLVPCSFCGVLARQNTGHCMVSGGCCTFQRFNVDRHTALVQSLLRFFVSRTRFVHCVSCETVLHLDFFGPSVAPNVRGKMWKPDLVMQDPISAELILVDVTVVLIPNMLSAARGKESKYQILSDTLGAANPTNLTRSGLAVKPVCCEVVPVVWSVFGDLLDASWDHLLDCVPGRSVASLSQCLEESLAICGKNARDIHWESSRLYRLTQRLVAPASVP
jgi:hypothetical protein